MRRRFIREFLLWTKAFAAALMIVLMVNVFLTQVYRVNGESMEPTLVNHEPVILWKWIRDIHYGEIVVIDPRVNRQRTWVDKAMDNFLLSRYTGEHWIKRVIGKPGDEMEFKDGHLYRNGTLLEESYLKEAMKNVPNKRFTVPDGTVFVMGDNRNNSLDSRAIGPIPVSHVLGRVMFRHF